ncbi:hypothetical protein [Salinisphaera japonica]|uniref:Uncharacterized protein n=1 Tax=Salinisphaera japonica YTM-1 TaxID=1209778 RepID=A0A423Q2X1_9GAMM|nr:hypothetical protein [Salinisphaera japonica]ROO32893.1 hypothetical protein SAJA_00005 [Salinisphaera japonica YTM-1]
MTVRAGTIIVPAFLCLPIMSKVMKASCGVLASFFPDYPQSYADDPDGGLSTVSFIRPWRHGFCGFALDRASDAFEKTANARSNFLSANALDTISPD